MVDAVDFEGAAGHLIGLGTEPAGGVLDFFDCGFLGQLISSLSGFAQRDRRLVPGGGIRTPTPEGEPKGVSPRIFVLAVEEVINPWSSVGRSC